MERANNRLSRSSSKNSPGRDLRTPLAKQLSLPSEGRKKSRKDRAASGRNRNEMKVFRLILLSAAAAKLALSLPLARSDGRKNGRTDRKITFAAVVRRRPDRSGPTG